MPGSLKAHVLLSVADSRTNRLPQAIKECEAVLAALPDDYGATLILGRDLVLAGSRRTPCPS